MTTRFETAITNRAAATIAAAAGRPGPAASTARAWIDSMTARAQLRAVRRLRHTRAA
ncbi:hypothetical protein MSIMFB_04479 [Mycobacterium simulans]|uniref:Amidohydrolase n=1 Tax=Mycobacterium simulans TaxID=627089 RepID=A0A7Z7IQS6_9MYCO|nr:amidohydrolase [Mycobacterium simulans]SOJ57001.1 hypothetical protein MSIMFB_04479 [Mycobacterium simulans]